MFCNIFKKNNPKVESKYPAIKFGRGNGWFVMRQNDEDSSGWMVKIIKHKEYLDKFLVIIYHNNPFTMLVDNYLICNKQAEVSNVIFDGSVSIGNWTVADEDIDLVISPFYLNTLEEAMELKAKLEEKYKYVPPKRCEDDWTAV